MVITHWPWHLWMRRWLHLKLRNASLFSAAYLHSRSLLAVSEALRKRRSVPRVRRQNTGGLNRQQTRRRNSTSSAREDEQPTGPDYNPENPYHVSNAFIIKVMHKHARNIHTLPVKSLEWFRFFFSPRLPLFDQKYSKNSNIVKYYYNLKELFSVNITIFAAFNITILNIFLIYLILF